MRVEDLENLRLVSIKEASKITGIPKSTFYHLLHMGKIKAVKIGGRYYLSLKMLKELTEKGTD